MARRISAALAVAGLAAIVGCGSNSGTPATTTAGAPTTTGSSTTATATQPSTTPATGTTGSSSTAQILLVTTALRAELLAAGAASHNLPVSAYTGLVPGRTYYAYDPATATYWAGAALVPSRSSVPAQVSVQDDGSYLLFSRTAGSSWQVESVGMTGIAGAKCPVAVPATVLAVWGWAPGTCRPAA